MVNSVICAAKFVFFVNLAICFAEEDDPIVSLTYGKIKGHILQSENDNVYYAFQEIPFASPPVDELRFKEPIAPSSWDGILDATKNTKMCYQQSPIYAPPNLTESEDCLYLNVYTPQLTANRGGKCFITVEKIKLTKTHSVEVYFTFKTVLKPSIKKPSDSFEELLPVFFWIHGGGFLWGTGAPQQYGPKLLMDQDIVVVSINYRLGVLGFLTTEDGVIPGNLGLKDQNFALQWVKDNIKQFGGDPDKVTIADLFRGAILESGTSICPFALQRFSRSIAFQAGQVLNSNFTSQDSADLLNLLKSIPAINLSRADVPVPINSDMLWGPLIEDEELDGAFITGLLHEDIKNGNINQVPIIIGYNSEEEISFIAQDQSGLKQKGVTYDEDLSSIIGILFNMTDDNKKTAGAELKKIYTDGAFQDDFGALVSYTTDSWFSTPSSRHAELQSKYTDVYLYQMSYKGELGNMMIQIEGVDPNGVGHGEELYYIWESGANSDSSKYPKEDILTRNRLLKLWSNFVKYLNPTPEEDDLLENVIWTKVSEDSLTYLNINATLEVKTDPKAYRQWKKIIDTYAITPYILY